MECSVWLFSMVGKSSIDQLRSRYSKWDMLHFSHSSGNAKNVFCDIHLRGLPEIVSDHSVAAIMARDGKGRADWSILTSRFKQTSTENLSQYESEGHFHVRFYMVKIQF